MFACYEDIAPLTEDGVFLKTLVVTMAVTCGFLISKTTYDAFRRNHARATFVIIGGGPCGLIASLIVARTGKASRIVIYEEKHRSELVNRPQQLAFEQKNVHFLKSFGVDFDNIEGCWQHKRFFTRIGVFTEYMLSIIYRLDVTIVIHLNQKFTRDTLKSLEAFTERLVVIVCDGSHGRSASLLGLSDEFVHHSCKAYGAVAALDRPSEQVVPAPEIRVHNLTFDLHAFGNNSHEELFPQGFHLKIFGSLRHRYMALAVPKCESRLVKTLKVVLDQSVMRSIFQACYNAYKTDDEGKLTDLSAVKSMKFSPRLFEIKLSQRMEVAAFVQDANLFVLTEGEAARVLNFHSGMDVNLTIKSLYSLETFIHMAVPAESETSILKALQYKCTHSRTVTQEYLRCGIRESMFLC